MGTKVDTKDLGTFRRGEVFRGAYGLVASTGLDVFRRREVFPYEVQVPSPVTPVALSASVTTVATLIVTPTPSVTASASVTAVGTLTTVSTVNSTASASVTAVGTLTTMRVSLVTLNASVATVPSLITRRTTVPISGTASFGIDMAGNNQALTFDFIEYKLDEVSGLVAVESQDGQNGAYHGSPTLGDLGVHGATGQFFIPGTSVDLDGVNDYIDVTPALEVFPDNTQITLYGYFSVASPSGGPSSLLDVQG